MTKRLCPCRYDRPKNVEVRSDGQTETRRRSNRQGLERTREMYTRPLHARNSTRHLASLSRVSSALCGSSLRRTVAWRAADISKHARTRFGEHCRSQKDVIELVAVKTVFTVQKAMYWEVYWQCLLCEVYNIKFFGVRKCVLQYGLFLKKLLARDEGGAMGWRNSGKVSTVPSNASGAHCAVSSIRYFFECWYLVVNSMDHIWVNTVCGFSIALLALFSSLVCLSCFAYSSFALVDIFRWALVSHSWETSTRYDVIGRFAKIRQRMREICQKCTHHQGSKYIRISSASGHG